MDRFELLIVGKFCLTFGVLLGIPIWQLYSLRRERRDPDRLSKSRLHQGRTSPLLCQKVPELSSDSS